MSWKKFLLSSLVVSSTFAKTTPEVFRIDFDIHRGNSKSDMSPKNIPYLRERDGSLDMEIENQRTFYMANLKIGSNDDEVSVAVDTGSSDLWVMSHDVICDFSTSSSLKRNVVIGNELDDVQNEKNEDEPHAEAAATSTLKEGVTKASENEENDSWPIGTDFMSLFTVATATATSNSCTQYGSFNTGRSDSFRRNNSAPEFSISYADNTYAIGIWGYDHVDIGNTVLNNLSFAVANETTSNIGVLGIGLPGLEVTYTGSNAGTNSYQYENLPMKLKSQGIIDKNAYSLYLGDSNSAAGSVLFGAVDHAKYTGTLETIQIINTYSQYYDQPLRLEVLVDDISFNNSESEVSISDNVYVALLDSGSTLTYFPTSLLEKVGETLNGQWSSSAGAYIVDCTSDQSYKFVFNFSGKKIEVPLTDFLLNYRRNQCYLGIFPQSQRYILFGDNFLRSTYVVYDLENFEISLAQANYSEEEDIELISSSVPSAVNAAGYSETSLPTASIVEGSATTTVTYETGTLTNSAALGETLDSTTTGSSSISSPRSTSSTGTGSESNSSASSSPSGGSSSSDASTNGNALSRMFLFIFSFILPSIVLL